jgi:hypothetical protein
MLFDPEKFGAAMGEAIRAAVEPLQKEIASLKEKLAQQPDIPGLIATAVERAVASIPAAQAGKDCDMEAVKAMVAETVKGMPVVHGKDGAAGAPGTDGKDGAPGVAGPAGEKGVDGLSVAGAMIDRDGALQFTLSNGEVKNLGTVVGKDGTHGKDGTDGIGFDSFELEYLPDTHEIAIKAVCGIRTKELRYPAGGIRPAGYWREGTKARAGEAWVHDGSTFYAAKDTESKPESKSADWIIGARKGRDGETTIKTINANPGPIKLGQ